jgi:hypothetical protein
MASEGAIIRLFYYVFMLHYKGDARFFENCKKARDYVLSQNKRVVKSKIIRLITQGSINLLTRERNKKCKI